MIGRLAGTAVLAGALFAAGCKTVGPDYRPSAPDLPAAWHAPVPDLFDGSAPEGPWWGGFDDPVLESLVEETLDANLDVAVALSRVREARAAARGVVADTGPSAAFSGEAGVDARSESGDDADDDTDSGGRVDGVIDGSWEIDLFGRVSRSREAAWARFARQQALSHETRRLAAAEAAGTYIRLRAVERRLELTERALQVQQRTLDLVRQRVDAGLAPALDRVRAQAQVATTRAELGPLRSQAQRFRNALAVLTADVPGAMDQRLADRRGEVPAAAMGRAAGVPADLLRRRPDIRAAELQIAAATADVGVATADLYPRLVLPGSLGVGVTGIGEGSVTTSVFASLSALFTFPLFDGGAREAALGEAEERLVQASLAYRQALLRALQEVESALTGYRGARERRIALAEAVENNRTAYEQSRELYRQGFVTFIDVLDSQRAWNISLQSLAMATRDVSLEVVNLYSALAAVPQAQASTDAEQPAQS